MTGITLSRAVQSSRYSRDGKYTDTIVCTYMIGEHGPFVEELPKTDDWQAEFERRAQALKLKLDNLAR